MNKQRDQVTNLQLAFIILSTMFGVSILSFIRFVVKYAGLGAPLASLVGILLGFIGLLGLVFIGKRFPKKTIIGYNEIILGKGIGKVFSLLIILIFAVLMGLETRHYAEAIQGSILPNTPIQVAIIVMISLCATTSFQNVSTFAYIHFFYIPLILIPVVVIFFPVFKDVEIYHLTPFLGHEPSFKDFMLGAMTTMQAVGNFTVIAMVIPFMKDPKKSMKGAVWGYWITGAIVVFIVTITVAVFGEEEILQMFWPILILGRMIQIPAEIFSRIDAVLLISWIYGVFTTLLSYYFIVVRGICELFRFHHYRVISICGAPVVFLVAMAPNDIYTMYDYILVVVRYGLLPLLGYPFLLLILAAIRHKKGEAV
ncbi:GerAB/ArcD/ProY family transporter [Salinibacillus xinjiangensis]|uniref:GerAB/ArcD/ProY family transporter n=1 Tax=Salinibacillus xinjiangensis TaxID=1229268 RepID=A0A6G1X1F0_9BACI|nr:endospore germination permease [Salinibacillus xinjiangensis]MRG84705.1 GerAB/ArcD/ProY family transporter [Salinibacillus xinjiangensis]